MEPRRRIGQLGRRVATCSLALLLAAAAGCSTSGSNEGAEPPTSGGSATSTTSPVEDDAPGVVWQEVTQNEFAAEPPVPSVVIYEDGRLFRGTTDGGGVRVIETGTVEPAALEAFLDEAASSELFENGVDFGEADPSMSLSTDVSARIDGVLRTASVPFDASDQTSEQAARQAELEALADRAADLATDVEPWTPDRVRATTSPGILSSLDPDLIETMEPAPWPGPPFDAFPEPDGGLSCLVIEGDDAATVFEAAADNVAGFWTEGDDVWQIVVTPMLPGQEGCPR